MKKIETMFILYLLIGVILLQSAIGIRLIRKVHKSKDIWNVCLIFQRYIHNASINYIKWVTFYVVLKITQRYIFGLGIQYQPKENYPELLFKSSLFKSKRVPLHIKNTQTQIRFFYDRQILKAIKEKILVLLSGQIDYDFFRDEVAAHLLKLQHHDLFPQILKELQKPVTLFIKTSRCQKLQFDFFVYAAQIGVLTKFKEDWSDSLGFILNGEDTVLKSLQEALRE